MSVELSMDRERGEGIRRDGRAASAGKGLRPENLVPCRDSKYRMLTIEVTLAEDG